MKKRNLLWGIFLAGPLVFFLAGPKVRIDTQIKPVTLAEDLDECLAASEAQFAQLVPNTEKTIVWANSEKTKTPLSVVYLHGYSATRQETAPLADEIASQLGANLFYTRLTGHGLSGEALAQANVNDWLNDATEALEIGKRLGDKVIVLGVSTGGTLAAWLAMQPDNDAVLAYVMLSPNFAPKDARSEIFTWPWAKQLVPVLLGPEYSWEPVNPEHALYWTERYPSEALLQMMALVKHVRESRLETITKPVLVVYSPSDQVVNSQKTEQVFASFGADVKQITPITEKINAENHVLAGNILAPDNTARVEQIILDFLAPLK